MRFIIKKQLPLNELVLMNRLGYHAQVNRSDNLRSYIRRLHRLDYPRFHVYLTRHKDEFIITLHLDEKKPSYAGTNRHAGQYDSDMVHEEMKRILSFIDSL